MRRWGWRVVLAVVWILPLVVFGQAALLCATFHTHDLQYYFLPYHALPVRLMALGNAPLWNPYVFSGLPLLGDGQTALFYPPNWLFFLLPTAAALNYVVLTQFMIAGSALLLYARHLGLGHLPALTGAIAYTFGGCLTARVVHLSNLSGAALIPLLFLAVDHALRSQRPRAFVLAAMAIATQTVCGHPQTPVYTAVGLLLYALVAAVERLSADGRRRWLVVMPLQLVATYALAYGLAAIQLVPWIELGRLSPRAAGASFDFIMNGSTHGSQWLWFVFPYLSGALQHGLFADQPLSLVDSVTLWEHTAYVGLLPLGLAALGLLGLVSMPHRYHTDGGGALATCREPMHPAVLARRWFAALAFAMLLALGVILAAGKYTPAGALLYAIPVIGKLREIERAIVLAAFALSMLAALGLQQLIDGCIANQWSHSSRRTVLLIAAAIVLIPAICVAVVQYPDLAAACGMTPADVRSLAPNRPNIGLPLLFGLISAALLAGYGLRSPPSRWLSVSVVGVVLADLAIFAAWFNPVTSPDYHLREPAVLATLRADSGPFRKVTYLPPQELDTRRAQETLAISWGILHGIEDINGFNSLQPRRYTDYLFGPGVSDVSYGYLSDETLLDSDHPVLSSLNVKYVLVPSVTTPTMGTHYRLCASNAFVAVYENLQVYPRAWYAERVRAVPDPKAVLRTVTARGFDGRREALVEAEAVPPELEPMERPAPDLRSRAPVIVERGPNHLVLTTDTPTPRFLVLSEMYFPGWRATVDGRATRIFRTNYLFRGIVVPAGAHRVAFHYRPGSLWLGAGISLLSLLGAGMIWRWDRRRGEVAA